jgi:hypothetical protein
MHGLSGTEAWLHHILQDGAIGFARWQSDGLTVRTDHAYTDYEDFSKRRHAYRPDDKPVWSKKVRKALRRCVSDTRQTQGTDRIRCFQFASLVDCRRQFATHVGAPDIEWEPENNAPQNSDTIGEATALIAPPDAPELEWETEPDFEWEPEPDFEWEPVEDEP